MASVLLTWVDPSTDETEQGVFELPVTFGRAPDCTIVLASGLVSGKHAKLVMEPTGLAVEDLGSRNGTFVNGKRTQRATVQLGDVVAIGPYAIVPSLEPSDVRLRIDWTDPRSGQTRTSVHRLPFSVGRERGNDLVLDDPSVQGRQLAIYADASGVVTAQDLTNAPTLSINGQRTVQGPLGAGAAAQLGPYQLVITVDSAARRRSAGESTVVLSDAVAAEIQAIVASVGASASLLPGGPSAAAPNAIDPALAAAYAPTAPLSPSVVDMARSLPRTNVHQQAFPATAMPAMPPAPQSQPSPYSPPSQPGPYSQPSQSAFNPPSQPSNPGASFAGAPPSSPGGVQASGPAWPPPFFSEQLVPVQALASTGLPVYQFDYATIGAGLGGFIWVDNLVVRGVRPDRVAALGVDPVPYSRYRRLCRNSQIPDHERLRSNSEATPDNLWGWPGYAMREIVRDTFSFSLLKAMRTSWQIFGEPTITQTYTPIAADVYKGIDDECRRIGWEKIMRYGRVRSLRKTNDGRYIVAYSQNASGPSSHAFLLTPFLHLATGYPALQFLPDLQRYREDTGDFRSVVNAYEDHDHIYKALIEKGGVVLVRGRGIVASRILQRLWEARASNKNIYVVHALRSPLTRGHRWGKAERPVHQHFEMQPFNWPKACWGGEFRYLLERTPPAQRKALFSDWGGTTTADRRDWIKISDEGVREGWYQIVFGEVQKVERNAQGKIVTVIRGKGGAGGELRYEADYIIDATGLDAKASGNPVIKDLIDHYKLAPNVLGRIAVENDFEIPGLRNGNARAYGAGALVAGGPFAPVDSFLGLQYTATTSIDAMRRAGAPGIGGFGPFSSSIQWLKWLAGATP